MTDLKIINEILRHNEEIARKFFEIEKKILTILNYTDLFEVLLTEIRKKFRVPGSDSIPAKGITQVRGATGFNTSKQ